MNPTTRFFSSVALVASAFALGGCSSSSDAEQGQPLMMDAGNGGSECPASQLFSYDMAATSSSGLTVKLESNPASPSINESATWTLKIADASGPVIGKTVTVSGQMSHPSFSHGLGKVPVVKDNGDGTYTASGVDFNMNGPWAVTIQVDTDAVTYHVCVE